MRAPAIFAEYEELRRESDAIARAVVADASQQCSDWGSTGVRHEDIVLHVNTLASALLTGSAPLWVNHLGWAKSYLIEHGASGEDVACMLDVLRENVLQITSSNASIELMDLGRKALATLPERIDCSHEAIQPYAETSSEYLQYMLQFDKESAWAVVRATDLPLADLYIHVIGPAQHQLGTLWQAGKITSAQEHYCTAATVEMMAQLRSGFEHRRDGRRLIAATVGGDRHDIGIRMISDLFEYNGWVSLFLGCDVPARDIVQVACDYNASIIAISVSMTAQLPEVMKVTAALRESTSLAKVLVGGQPLLLAPELYELLGADDTAADPKSAISTALALLAT